MEKIFLTFWVSKLFLIVVEEYLSTGKRRLL
jgi:hypothetical protein